MCGCGSSKLITPNTVFQETHKNALKTLKQETHASNKILRTEKDLILSINGIQKLDLRMKFLVA